MSEFSIDILDANGARVGDGPLVTAQSMTDTRSLDKIGSAQFTLPAEDPRTAYIGAGAQFDLYDRVDGYLGRYYYRAKTLDAQAAGGAQLVVTCHDQLMELARQTVYFRRAYINVPVDDVIADLVAVAGWGATADAGIGQTSVTYEGESVFAALDVLRDRWGQHFRLGAPRVLEFGAFGLDSGVVLANLSGQVQVEFAANRDIALVDQIRLVEESDEIFNRIVPLGAGQGVSQLTIAPATLGAYPTLAGANEDGSAFYYIQDSPSIAAYGRRDKVLLFPSIRPITNSDANLQNAANALKLAAEVYMARHLIPKVMYGITLRALRRTLRVGDLVRLQYRGIVDGYSYIDVDDLFYVMDVTRRRDSTGARSATLVVSTIADRRTSDTDIVLEVINDLRALKISVPITLAYSPVGPYVKRMNATNAAEFTVRLGLEVLFLNYAKLRFRTSPLKSSVAAVATAASSAATSTAGGSSTPTSSSGGSSTPTSSTDGSQTPTSSSGGGSTPTSSTDGSQTPSSGASSATTTVDGGNHVHNLGVVLRNPKLGETLFLTSGGLLNTLAGVDTYTGNGAGHDHNIDHTHLVNIAGHSHTVTISAHTHTVTISSHNHTVSISAHTHTVTIGTHTHDVTIPSHNHTVSYGIFADTNYPQTISLAINGVNVTTALGGPWALTNASVEVEVDITTYLVNAAGGLRQNHRLVFSCASGLGEIEAEVDILTSIQPIAVA